MTKNNEIIKKFYKSELTNINNLLLNNKISIDKKEKLIRIKEYLKSLNENNY